MVTPSTIRVLHQRGFVNFLALTIFALSLLPFLSYGEISRTFRTEGSLFRRSRTEVYAGDVFFLIAYGKPIPSGIYVSPGFPQDVHDVLEDPEWSELERIFNNNRGLEAAYRACHAGELVSSIFGSIDRVTAL